MSNKYKKSVKINENTVSKKRNNDVLELYEYLNIRNFDNFPKVIDVTEEEIRSEYVENVKYYEMVDGIELIKTMATLHNKTIFYKDVSKNKYQEIYDKILENIEYLKEYYEKIIDEIECENYMSPSHYLFARNYSIILGSLKYSESELKKWFSLVKDKSNERVCIVHNNISKDHFIKGDKNYLISWEKHLVDTPILDLYKFYKKDGFKMNFKALYEEYNIIMQLSNEEDKLFKILISIPPRMEFIDDEFLNTIYVKDNFKYIYESYRVTSK